LGRPDEPDDPAKVMRKLGLMITCKEASRALSQMQDGDVAFPLYLRIRLHLLLCDACTRFARQMRFLHLAMQRYRQ
jgi:hypothetical protein